MAGGAAVADFDNDGDIDLFMPNSEGTPDQLYENQGDGSFLDITSPAGTASSKNHRAALWFDADNDNLLDLLVAGDCYCTSTVLFHIPCKNGLTLAYFRRKDRVNLPNHKYDRMAREAMYRFLNEHFYDGKGIDEEIPCDNEFLGMN